MVTQARRHIAKVVTGYTLTSALLLSSMTGCSSIRPTDSLMDGDTLQSETDADSSSSKTEHGTELDTQTEDGVSETAYMQIDQKVAKEMMGRDDGHIIVDVRRQDEYDAGHIPDAVLIPNESIGTERPEELPDLDQIILVYCRSGRRSKEAAQKLADMGYSHVYELGGIIDWTGDVVTDGETG